MTSLQIREKKISQVDSLMWKVTKLLTKQKKILLDEFDLTCSQFEILAAIYEFTKDKKNEVIQINLSEKANIDPMTTSTVLRNLQKRNLIKRERGLVNTRTVEVELTTEGEKLYCLAQQKLNRMTKDIYQNLDQQQLTSQLLKLSDKLNKLKY